MVGAISSDSSMTVWAFAFVELTLVAVRVITRIARRTAVIPNITWLANFISMIGTVSASGSMAVWAQAFVQLTLGAVQVIARVAGRTA